MDTGLQLDWEVAVHDRCILPFLVRLWAVVKGTLSEERLKALKETNCRNVKTPRAPVVTK